MGRILYSCRFPDFLIAMLFKTREALLFLAVGSGKSPYSSVLEIGPGLCTISLFVGSKVTS